MARCPTTAGACVAAVTELAEFEALAELEALRAANRTLELKLKNAKAKTEDLVQAVYQGAKDASLIQRKPPEVPRPKPDRRTKRAEVALLHLSDLHFGKRTPSFNSDVAADRLAVLGMKVAKITEIERADHPVRTACLLLGGDLAENLGIFPGQAYEVDSSTFEQMFAAVNALVGLISVLLGVFHSLAVYEVPGNHGRIGRKGDYPRSDNIDRMIGAILRERVKGYEREARLRWHEPDGWFNIVTAGNYRALLVHGDQIKSFGGNTPAFGILRKANAWASGVLPPFTDMYMGHFHQSLVLPLANGKGRVFVVPSIESDSPYAKEFVAATGTPAQRLNFIDPDKGRVTSERLIYLD